MTIKVKLAAIAKDEAAYIPQWIHHHIAFGFEEIEIWLNNTTDNSVELLKDIQLKHPETIIKFKVVDEFLAKCLAEDLQFQQCAYTEIYNEALGHSELTHIIFLDLDEFWVPDDFKTTISEFVASSPDADAISFQWMIDIPEPGQQIFSPPFSYHNNFQKNRHVKTLTKLTNNMSELSVHNHLIEDGVYILADGTEFPGTDKETIHKSLVPISFQKMNGSRLERAFILHQINRSPIEYLSSLLRGRGHKNDQKIFKANRIGYILDNQSSNPIEFHINLQRIVEHNRSLAKYLNDFSTHVLTAQQFVINRFWSATQILREKPDLLTTFRDQVRGVKLNNFLAEPIISDQLFFALDNTRTTPEGLLIEGWAFDALSSAYPIISAETEDGELLVVHTYRHDRPDVEKLYPDAPKGCGFKVTVISSPLNNARLFITSSSTTKAIMIQPTINKASN